MLENGLMMQYFEWHIPNDGKHWQRLKEDAAHLKQIGVTSVWIPPCYKATGTNDVGYGIYDAYDLGEFNQKGDVRTKYGNKEDLLAAIEELHKEGLWVYADIILNHRAGADKTERFFAYEVAPDNRQQILTDAYEIEGWTGFTFPGRKNQYSDFKWHWYHFSGVDVNNATGKQTIYMIAGENKGWADDDTVDTEFGNFDYLMNADIDYAHPEVVQETKTWVDWFIEETKIDGARLDAIKHINADFMIEFVDYVRQQQGKDFYFVGEYWNSNYQALEDYFKQTQFEIDLFDVKLHHNLHQASLEKENYDLTKIFSDTITEKNPTLSVTFVDNHDSQPGEALESYVETWFKPLAYSLSLLRESGMPTLFYGDYYGIEGPDPRPGMGEYLDKLAYIRSRHAYGQQDDYFDNPNCIGWVRQGNEEHPFGCAVVLSNKDATSKRMLVGEQYAGQYFADYTSTIKEKILIDEEGFGDFPVLAQSVSVWVVEDIGDDEAFQEVAVEPEMDKKEE